MVAMIMAFMLFVLFMIVPVLVVMAFFNHYHAGSGLDYNSRTILSRWFDPNRRATHCTTG